jgi:hypothetical protein
MRMQLWREAELGVAAEIRADCGVVDVDDGCRHLHFHDVSPCMVLIGQKVFLLLR